MRHDSDLAARCETPGHAHQLGAQHLGRHLRHHPTGPRPAGLRSPTRDVELPVTAAVMTST
ncbi:MAG TPA: hypothetical protein VID05_06035, partial [Acidimicrobiales bacterium]